MYKKWTQEDITFLKENYSKFGGSFCSERLDRKINIVHMKAGSLGLNRDFWTEDRLAFLEENYPKYGRKYCSEKLGCPLQKVVGKAKYIKLKRDFTEDVEVQKERLEDIGKTYESPQEKRKKWYDIPHNKIVGSIRTRIRVVLKNKKKSAHSLDLIGCSAIKLKEYLESKFLPGMSWENYGFYGWHIDHIRPCSSFNMLDPEEQRKCFHYSNLQPLWANDNRSKSDKWDGDSVI